jgi:ABC transport system ATP-binding/permease protein
MKKDPPPRPPPVDPTVVDTGKARGESGALALEGASVARVPLQGRTRLVFGREGADVELDSPVVSHRHATLTAGATGHVLEDRGSMNGTFIGTQRVRMQLLREGDVFRIGPFEIEYQQRAVTVRDVRGALRVDAREVGRRVGGDRWILRDVSLSILPREFIALVGGSGAGKSTLMRALSAQITPTTGIVLYNGEDAGGSFERFRAILGYVPQDDILHRELPVHRALAYAAYLRLPPDTTEQERARRIQRALADVDMTEHAQKQIVQLSGGQRKRVSIASELLADPALFFLDEPTSGLDPGLEKKMMKTLRGLADGGRTIVLVTHATANLDQCDHVAFVAEGRLVYFGPPAEALPFFRVDSGDMADIYGKLEGTADPKRPERWQVATRDLGLTPEQIRGASTEGGPPPLSALWEAAFRRSKQYARNVRARSSTAPRPDAAKSSRHELPRVSAFRQFAVLSVRYLDLLIQDRKNLAVLLLQAPLIAYLTTLVAKQTAVVGKGSNSYDAKVVLFLMATVAAWFGVINAAREIAKETPIFQRERLAGLRIAAYVGSKLFVLSLLVAVQSAVLLTVIGTKVDFPDRGVVWTMWPELFVTTFLSSLAAVCLGLAISAAARTPDRAISTIPLALVPQILFSGVLFPLGGDGSVMRILSWFTLSRWATDAYGVTVHLTRFIEMRSSSEYAFTFSALTDKWLALGAHAAIATVITGVLLTLRGRGGD